MIFGEVDTARAEGAILAHAVRLPGQVLKKGRRLSAEDVASLQAEGVRAVTVARLEPGDVAEDDAARAVAEAIAGPGIDLGRAFTGRCNLFASVHGLAVVDRARVDALNRVDEAVTVATVAPFDVVEAGQMVATVKIIPFAVTGTVCERCRTLAMGGGLIRVQGFRPTEVGLLLTTIPGAPDRSLELAAENVCARVVALGSRLAATSTCPHRAEAVAGEVRKLLDSGCGMILVFGAVSTLDRRDVVPAGIAAAGGTVEHVGMPVDPGNLLVLARHGHVPVIGLPGCVRSPKLNGFDWVLQRLLAGVPVGGADLAAMGVGGLLKEIPERPQPRAGDDSAPVPRKPPKVAAIVLAAGQSRRMGSNKLTGDFAGRPLVVHAVRAALESRASPVVVVTGFEAEKVRAALAGHDVRFVHNPDYARGMSASLIAGIGSLPDDIDGALVCLGDMPRVSAGHLDRLIAAFDPAAGRAIGIPTYQGKRGNPVLWARRFFPRMRGLAGDVGARALIGEHADLVFEVEVEDDGVLFDIDTPQGLTQAKAGAQARP
jgi:molybdenum cofactor cytidylyltransferase